MSYIKSLLIPVTLGNDMHLCVTLGVRFTQYLAREELAFGFLIASSIGSPSLSPPRTRFSILSISQSLCSFRLFSLGWLIAVCCSMVVLLISSWSPSQVCPGWPTSVFYRTVCLLYILYSTFSLLSEPSWKPVVIPIWRLAFEYRVLALYAWDPGSIPRPSGGTIVSYQRHCLVSSWCAT